MIAEVQLMEPHKKIGSGLIIFVVVIAVELNH